MVTVYAEDDEAFDIWTKEVGVPVDKVVRIATTRARYASDNFWMMGDTAPAAPAPRSSTTTASTSPAAPGSPDEDGDRFIEIWNNVFMQFNRDEAGVMHPLPKPSVDTGMGLERIAAVLQHVHANYEIDLFQNLIKAAVRETNRRMPTAPRCACWPTISAPAPSSSPTASSPATRGAASCPAPHHPPRHPPRLEARRAPALLPQDGAGSVAEMGEAYPELKSGQSRVMDMLKLEEERFFATIDHGMAILEANWPRWPTGSKVFNGETAFKLHDTYGFPLDLTADICREHQRSGRLHRLRCGDGTRQKRTGARRRQVQDGRAARIRRPQHHLPWLRHARGQGQRAGALQGRRCRQ